MASWSVKDHERFEKLTKDLWARRNNGLTLDALRNGYTAFLKDFRENKPDFVPENNTHDVMQAVQLFQDFMDGVLSHDVVVNARAEYIEVTMSRNYGKISMSWKLGATFNITSPASRSAAYDELYMDLNAIANEWERKSLGASLPGNPVQQSLPEGDEIIMCERLEVQVMSGRSYCKVTGGKFQKHGVRVWPEVLGKAGINIEDITPAGLDLTGYTAVIEMKSGKPQKVRELTKDE